MRKKDTCNTQIESADNVSRMKSYYTCISEEYLRDCQKKSSRNIWKYGIKQN